MPNQNPKNLRAGTKRKTKSSKANKVKSDYNKGKKKRQRIARVPFTPCQTTNTYNHTWPPPVVNLSTAAIGVKQNTNLDTKKDVEVLGEEGAKWFMATTLGKTIEDGTAPFRAGYFYSFSGARTFDCVYVDAATGHVYVIEAKGTKKGSAANLISRQNGKTQGNWDYLDEVVAEMEASGDPLKVAAAAKIKNAPNGKLHYVGVHTKYDTDVHGKVTASQPSSIFNKSR